MNAVQSALSSQRLGRIFFWISVAVLAGGLVVLIVKLADRGSSPAAEPSKPAAQTSGPVKSQQPPTSTIHRFSQVDPAAKSAISKFILGAVARKDLEGAWRYVEPGSDIRAGVSSLRQWKRGEIPVVPFPVYQFKKSNYEVVYGTSKKLLIDVALVPTPRSHMRPTVFRIGLNKVGKGANSHWLVNYWLPRWTAPFPDADQ